MKVWELTDENFTPFGKVLTKDDTPPVNSSLEFVGYGTAREVSIRQMCCTGILCCRLRRRILLTETPE